MAESQSKVRTFLKKAESATYCWLFENFPRKKVTKVKHMFKIELCGQRTTWSLNVSYDPAYSSASNEYRVYLLHHGRSIVHVEPELTATLLRNNRSPIVYEKKLECSRIVSDWECFPYIFQNLKIEEDETIDYRFNIEVRISYQLLEKCATDELWNNVVPPYGLDLADLQELLKWEKKKDITDLEIATKTEEFYVTRERLCQRSIGFYKMYVCEKCKENEVLKIDDVDTEVVREMLHYLYTGTVNCIDDVAEDLLVLVDRYDIPGLKVDCEISILNRLKADNSAKMAKLAKLAKRYQLKKLQKKVARLQR